METSTFVSIVLLWEDYNWLKVSVGSWDDPILYIQKQNVQKTCTTCCTIKWKAHINSTFQRNELTFCANRTASFSVENFTLIKRKTNKSLLLRNRVCWGQNSFLNLIPDKPMKSVQAILELNAQMVMMVLKIKFQVSGSKDRQSHSESFPVFVLQEIWYLKGSLVWFFSHGGKMETVWIQPFHWSQI